MPSRVSSSCAKSSAGKLPCSSACGPWRTSAALKLSACSPHVSLHLSAASCAMPQAHAARDHVEMARGAQRRRAPRSSRAPRRARGRRERIRAPASMRPSRGPLGGEVRERGERCDVGLGRRDALLRARRKAAARCRPWPRAASPRRSRAPPPCAPASFAACVRGEEVGAAARLRDRDEEAIAQVLARAVDRGDRGRGRCGEHAQRASRRGTWRRSPRGRSCRARR